MLMAKLKINMKTLGQLLYEMPQLIYVNNNFAKTVAENEWNKAKDKCDEVIDNVYLFTEKKFETYFFVINDKLQFMIRLFRKHTVLYSIKLAVKVGNMSYIDALTALVNRIGYVLDSDNIHSDDAKRFWQRNFSKFSKVEIIDSNTEKPVDIDIKQAWSKDESMEHVIFRLYKV